MAREANFCSECGQPAPVPNPPFCSQCGSRLADQLDTHPSDSESPSKAENTPISGAEISNESSSLDPSDLDALYARGHVYFDLGQYQEAIESFTKAIELDHSHQEIFYYRGNAYFNLGQYQRAIEDYDRAIELDPDYASAYFWRGEAYDNLGQSQRGIEDYDRAIELDSDYADSPNRDSFMGGLLKVIGGLFIVYSIADFGLSWLGINLVPFFPVEIAGFSPLIIGLLGSGLIYLGNKIGEIKSEKTYKLLSVLLGVCLIGGIFF